MDALNIDDMIDALTEATERLEDMKCDNVELIGTAGDDHAVLATYDAQIAQKYGMEASNREFDTYDGESDGFGNADYAFQNEASDEQSHHQDQEPTQSTR
jgi:hypothetical protein